MGYYTRFSLDVICDKSLNKFDIIKRLRWVWNSEASLAIDEYGTPIGYRKWYKHEEDIMDFSEYHPNVKFILRGDTDFLGVIWTKIFQNGEIIKWIDRWMSPKKFTLYCNELDIVRSLHEPKTLL